jgi:hypothetical protein
MNYAKTAATAGLALFSLQAAASVIPGLIDTGEGLAAGAIDTHYAFSVLSGTATGTPLGQGIYGVVGSPGWPVGSPWTTANVGLAQWLAPSANTAQSFDPVSNGIYDWTLAFNLTGYNPATASLSGQWAADNGGVVELNGVPLPGSAIDFNTDSGFTQLTGFSAQAGFKPGLNTLTFEVVNRGQLTGNPTGLLVDFTASNIDSKTLATPVPEPGSTTMLITGLGLLAVTVRRRSATV